MACPCHHRRRRRREGPSADAREPHSLGLGGGEDAHDDTDELVVADCDTGVVDLEFRRRVIEVLKKAGALDGRLVEVVEFDLVVAQGGRQDVVELREVIAILREGGGGEVGEAGLLHRVELIGCPELAVWVEHLARLVHQNEKPNAAVIADVEVALDVGIRDTLADEIGERRVEAAEYMRADNVVDGELRGQPVDEQV